MTFWTGWRKNLFLAEQNPGDNWPNLVNPSRRKLLAEFFEIDLDKIEQEKRALLDYVRYRNNIETEPSIEE